MTSARNFVSTMYSGTTQSRNLSGDHPAHRRASCVPRFIRILHLIHRLLSSSNNRHLHTLPPWFSRSVPTHIQRNFLGCTAAVYSTSRIPRPNSSSCLLIPQHLPHLQGPQGPTPSAHNGSQPSVGAVMQHPYDMMVGAIILTFLISWVCFQTSPLMRCISIGTS